MIRTDHELLPLPIVGKERFLREIHSLTVNVAWEIYSPIVRKRKRFVILYLPQKIHMNYLSIVEIRPTISCDSELVARSISGTVNPRGKAPNGL